MPVISVDLAYVNYKDSGVAIIEYANNKIHCSFQAISLTGKPDPVKIAEYIAQLCSAKKAPILMIDGPQGWKHPDNGLVHSRICERKLNTPAKTGLPQNVKPVNYAPFVRFSTEVFAQLAMRGWKLFDGNMPKDLAEQKTLIESFPLSAWKTLGIPSLPAKSKATQADIDDRLAKLKELFPLVVTGSPNHDELQALVAGLAGIALERGLDEGFSMIGQAPELLDGYWREGFIVNPRRP